MTSDDQVRPSDGILVERALILRMIQAGLWSESYRFARQIALGWLAAYPGDLDVLRWMSGVLAAEGKFAQAVKAIEKIIAIDPEDSESLVIYEQMILNQGQDPEPTRAKLYALGLPREVPLPDWARFIRGIRQNPAGEPDTPGIFARYLTEAPDEALIAIEHLKVARKTQDAQSTLTLAKLYQQRWPDVLIFRLASAEAMLLTGKESDGVNLIHRCAAEDAAGQVAHRWWPDANPYQALWPRNMSLSIHTPIPADVLHWMGNNQLPGDIPMADTPACDETTRNAECALPEQSNTQAESLSQVPEEYVEDKVTLPAANSSLPAATSGLEKAFSRVARQMNQPEIGSSDGRYPIYILFTSTGQLVGKYGEATTTLIDQELKKLEKAVRARRDWGCAILYADDAESTAAYGLTPVSPTDPWKLKLLLTDLDHALAAKGQRIGAVAILGGPEVIPFHRLPNPVDDVDPEVLSDNPYACLDSNYFIPVWPVGRIAGECCTDAGLLLQQIRAMTKYHQEVARKITDENRTGNSLVNFWRTIIQRTVQAKSIDTAFGYSASVWKRASIAVFRPIGPASKLLISPPATNLTVNAPRAASMSMCYYNLHGLEEAPEWYGQRDITDPAGVDYPIALKPASLLKTNKPPQIVFSEACYGGNIVDKRIPSSIALTYLSLGVSTFIGSTCVSYGSIGLPLISADLLGNLFWRYIKDNMTAGDAFLHAKIGLAREMTKRQGCLDGEDQKTLISFVLYGDPLFSYELNSRLSKRVIRSTKKVDLKILSDRDSKGQAFEKISNMPKVSDDILQKVRELVAPYLPGLDQAEIKIYQPGLACDAEGGAQSNAGNKNRRGLANRKTIVLRKQVEISGYKSPVYVRVTVDERGNPIKIVTSR